MEACVVSEDLFEGDIQAIQRNLLEIRDIQDPSIKWMRERGWWCRKLASPQNRSLMDYLCGKDTWVELIEFKAPGKTLTPGQEEEHKKARACGMRPVVFDNVANLKGYILRAEQNMLALRADGWDSYYEMRQGHAHHHEQGL